MNPTLSTHSNLPGGKLTIKRLSSLTPGTQYKIKYLGELTHYYFPIKQKKEREAFISFLNRYGVFEKQPHSHNILFKGLRMDPVIPSVRKSSEPKLTVTNCFRYQISKAGEGTYYTYSDLISIIYSIEDISDLHLYPDPSEVPGEFLSHLSSFNKLVQSEAYSFIRTRVYHLQTKSFSVDSSFIVYYPKYDISKLCTEQEKTYINRAIKKWNDEHIDIGYHGEEYINYINSCLKYSEYRGRCFSFRTNTEMSNSELYTDTSVHNHIYRELYKHISDTISKLDTESLRNIYTRLLNIWLDKRTITDEQHR